MSEALRPPAITIRAAKATDADGIARTFLDSAEYHAGLDPERYAVPDLEAISARYREMRQHPPQAADRAITLVAELNGDVVGFLDARLDESPDPMHQQI